METGVVAGACRSPKCERQALSPLVCSAIAALDPWCSGPTCQPVTLEIAGSNPVGSAISASTYAPSARPDGAFPCPDGAFPCPSRARAVMTLELTFRDKELAQVWIRPPAILDKVQPNFLDPIGAGRIVMGQVLSASRGLLTR